MAFRDERPEGAGSPGIAVVERLHSMLPPWAHAPVARYALTTLLVAIWFFIAVAFYGRGGVLGFFLLFPPVFIASVVFDRAAGLYATVLGTILLYVLVRPLGRILAPMEVVFSLVMFAVLAAGLAILADGLRDALVRARRAEREKDLLLQEMSHRVKNKFATIGSMITLQARQSPPDGRRALEAINGRIKVIADVHDYLQLARHEGVVDMPEYLRALCRSLGETLRDLKPVTVSVEVQPIDVMPQKALAIGLIVNELVINAFKYAFPGDETGTVHVRLIKRADELELSVIDDGVGSQAQTTPGLGTKLVRLLAAQLGGAVTWEAVERGCSVKARFPIRDHS
jgi:two-component sensor histidine kinase